MSARTTLASNLAALMEKFPRAGSQKLLFAASGVATSTVGRIRRAEVAATVDNVESLAKAFSLTASDLLDPSLPARLKLNVDADTERRARAAKLAAEIMATPLSDAQLQILSNTLAALRSA